MKSSDYFVKAYLGLDYSDLKAIDDLIGSIEAHLATHGSDTKLELTLHASKARKEEELNSGFDKVCATAKLVVDKLKDQKDWDVFEFDIFCGVLGRIESYELSIAMMEKSLDILERNFKNLSNYEYRKARISGEMTWRLTRAKFHDNVDPQKLKETFNMCFKSAMQVCEKLSLVALRTSLLVREAIFNENPTKILECVKAMEVTRDNYWIKSSKDEVVEYVRFLGDNVTIDLHNFMLGWQTKKRRTELGLKTVELANMIGTSQNIMSEMERGAKGFGTLRLYQIAKALKVQSMSYFYGEPLVSSAIATLDIHAYNAAHFVSILPEEKDKELAISLIKNLVDYSKDKEPQL